MEPGRFFVRVESEEWSVELRKKLRGAQFQHDRLPQAGRNDRTNAIAERRRLHLNFTLPSPLFTLFERGFFMIEETDREERSRASPGAAARGMAMTALRRVGELIEDPGTDPRVLLQAAKLVLAAAGPEDAEDGGVELRYTGGVDGDL